MIIKTKKRSTRFEDHQLPELRGSTIINMVCDPFEEMKNKYKHTLNELEMLRDEMKYVTEKQFSAGFAEGERAGRKAEKGVLKHQVISLADLVKSIQQHEANVIKNAEKFILNFAFKVAGKIIGAAALTSVELNKDVLQKMIEDAVNYFSDNTKYFLHVHGSALGPVKSLIPEIQANLGHSVSINVCENPSLKPGECLVETDYGMLDARFETQFTEIKKQILNNT